MATKFRFLPDIATADIAFEAYAKNPSELLENAGLALEAAMVSLDTVRSSTKHTFTKEEASLEDLLFSFLEELVFLKDAKGLLFNRLKCRVGRMEDGGWRVDTQLHGERVDAKKHKLGVDVKAVTKHMFEVKQLPDKTWYCRVILDI